MYHLFEKDRDIHESEADEKAPEALRITYQCCSELCKCSGKDLSVLSVKIAQMVSKTALRTLNVAVQLFFVTYFCKILGLYFI